LPAPRTLALGGLVAFLALVVLAHPLRPDLPPSQHFVSEYARGETGPLQVVAFLAWTVAMAAAVPVVAAARPPGRRLARAVAGSALAVAAAGALLAAAFATQTVAGELPAGVERTLSGRLHDLGTLLILAGLLLAALATLRIVRRRRYRLTVAALGLALLLVVPVLVALGADAPGTGQRLFILIGCAWQWRFLAEAT